MNYFVVGLGNPGSKYEKTRHNVAWIILNELYPSGWGYDKYLKAQYLLDGDTHFILPQTFMNASGESIHGLKNMYSIFNHEHLIVIYDDLDLPLGTIRISYDRGSGGHNGIKSIMEHLGSQKFIRIRVGIAKVLDDGRMVKPAVLGNFEPQEYAKVKELALEIQKRIESITVNGHQSAMNRYNSA